MTSVVLYCNLYSPRFLGQSKGDIAVPRTSVSEAQAAVPIVERHCEARQFL